MTKNQTQEKKKIAESALHYGLKKRVKVAFIDGSSIEGKLEFVNRYEYVLVDVKQKVKINNEVKTKTYDEQPFIILKASVKYLTPIE